MCIRDRLSSRCPGCSGAAERCRKLLEAACGVLAAGEQQERARNCLELLGPGACCLIKPGQHCS
eukprot:12460257-Alexandrium_andersonii.AAC.1